MYLPPGAALAETARRQLGLSVEAAATPTGGTIFLSVAARAASLARELGRASQRRRSRFVGATGFRWAFRGAAVLGIRCLPSSLHKYTPLSVASDSCTRLAWAAWLPFEPSVALRPGNRCSATCRTSLDEARRRL